MSNAARKLEEYKLSHWAQKYNTQKKGYFPTDDDIVELEMSKIKFDVKEEGNITLSDLTGGIGEQLFKMREYIINETSETLTPHCYFNELEYKRFLKAKETFGDLENFNMINTDIFKLKLGMKMNNANSGTIAICRNNPPYIDIDDEVTDSKVRFEDRSIYPNERTIMTNGIMIMEVPFNMLSDFNFIQKLTYRFDEINVFRFPKWSFDSAKNYRERQIVIYGKKKRNFNHEPEISSQLKMIGEMEIDDLKTLDEHEGYLYVIDDELIDKVRVPDLFRYKEVTDKTLTKGLESGLNKLLQPIEMTFESELAQNEKSKPIIEQTPGHIAVKFAAGAYNGVSKSNVLINGIVKKEVVTTTEIDGKKEYQYDTDKYTPVIEVVSSSGEFFIKENSKKEEEAE